MDDCLAFNADSASPVLRRYAPGHCKSPRPEISVQPLDPRRSRLQKPRHPPLHFCLRHRARRAASTNSHSSTSRHVMAGGPLLWAPQLTPKGSRRPLSSRPAVPFPASIAAWWPNCRAASSRSVFGLLREKRGDGIDAWRLGPASGPVVAASSESGADGPLQKQDFNQFLQFGPYQKESGTPKRTVRVLLSVPFRCHSLQMLCIGGSQFPFGWSFVSIAKLPMTWNPTDIWTAEVGMAQVWK